MGDTPTHPLDLGQRVIFLLPMSYCRHQLSVVKSSALSVKELDMGEGKATSDILCFIDKRNNMTVLSFYL